MGRRSGELGMRVIFWTRHSSLDYRAIRGFRLDVSWSQVQKEAAEDIQRGEPVFTAVL
jgi:hypothetical protein